MHEINSGYINGAGHGCGISPEDAGLIGGIGVGEGRPLTRIIGISISGNGSGHGCGWGYYDGRGYDSGFISLFNYFATSTTVI